MSSINSTKIFSREEWWVTRARDADYRSLKESETWFVSRGWNIQTERKKDWRGEWKWDSLALIFVQSISNNVTCVIPSVLSVSNIPNILSPENVSSLNGLEITFSHFRVCELISHFMEWCAKRLLNCQFSSGLNFWRVKRESWEDYYSKYASKICFPFFIWILDWRAFQSETSTRLFERCIIWNVIYEMDLDPRMRMIKVQFFKLWRGLGIKIEKLWGRCLHRYNSCWNSKKWELVTQKVFGLSFPDIEELTFRRQTDDNCKSLSNGFLWIPFSSIFYFHSVHHPFPFKKRRKDMSKCVTL